MIILDIYIYIYIITFTIFFQIYYQNSSSNSHIFFQSSFPNIIRSSFAKIKSYPIQPKESKKKKNTKKRKEIQLRKKIKGEIRVPFRQSNRLTSTSPWIAQKNSLWNYRLIPRNGGVSPMGAFRARRRQIDRIFN